MQYKQQMPIATILAQRARQVAEPMSFAAEMDNAYQTTGNATDIKIVLITAMSLTVVQNAQKTNLSAEMVNAYSTTGNATDIQIVLITVMKLTANSIYEYY